MGPSLQLSTQTEKTAVAMVTRSPEARRRGFLMTPARYVTYIRESTNQHLEILIIRLTLTQLLCPVTLTFDPLTLKLVNGVLVSRGPFLPSLVFVGLFVFPLGGGTGQTAGQTDRQIDRQTDRINTRWGLLLGRTAP